VGDSFVRVAELIQRRTGIALRAGSEARVLAGIERSMRRHGWAAHSDSLHRIERDDRLFDELVEAVVVPETYFFREPAQFEFIRRVVLPDVRARRGEEHALRIWSAGCATGEEAYSLAMLVADVEPGLRFSVLATDISREALRIARKGAYREWSLRGGAAGCAGRHLAFHDAAYRVAIPTRERVKFAYLNLALDAYPSLASGAWGMDLILCRNVFIYFDEPAVHAAAARLHETLADGGWLILGSADPAVGQFAPFERVCAPGGVFYRRSASGAGATRRTTAREPIAAPALPEAEPRSAPARTEPRDPIIASERFPVVAPAAAAIPARGGAPGACPSPLPLLREREEGDGRGWLERIMTTARRDELAAERACVDAAALRPLDPEVHFAHALLLLGRGRHRDAAAALRRVLYLDPSLAVAHFTLAAVARRQGDTATARRRYRTALALARSWIAREALPLSQGESAARLAKAAAFELAALADGETRSP
jgi:chemotaxis protein methyltransferase CheR